MSKHDKDNKCLLIGALIGGIVGCAATIFITSKCKKEHSSLESIGRILTHAGEALENDHKTHKSEDTVDDILGLVSTGVHLWKKFTKR